MSDNVAQDQDLQDIEQKFAPGEASEVEGEPDYGLNRERIPEKFQNIFKDLARKCAERDRFARIEEVRKAGMQRFYWRGDFDVCYDETNNTWAVPGGLGPWGTAGQQDSSDVELHYPFNIYQAFGRGFISVVGQVPHVRMEAARTFGPDSNRVASAADSLRRKIESHNHVEALAEDVARLMWTDGRVSLYSRWVTDGARFGYEQETQTGEETEGIAGGGNPPEKMPRQPKGGEVIEAYGVLECKVPINIRSRAQMMWRQLSFEIDSTSGKSMYPWVSKDLKGQGGTPGPGEYNLDRTTRLATTQGVRLLTESGDTVQALLTWQRTWFRPSFFTEIDNSDDRAWFEDNYPDGAMVAFLGETYCESRNESLDDHWTDVHPLPGDGQATPSCGYIIVSVQDAVNDFADLVMECSMKSIPAIICDKDVVNLQAIAKQKAGWGAHYPGTKPQDGKMEDGFFIEPTPELPGETMAFFQQTFSTIPQFLTGLFPSAIGEAEAANPTLGGQKLLSDASKGQAGVAWKKFRSAYAESMTQLVRLGAHFRAGEAENGIVKLSVEDEEVEIDLEDLRDGSWICRPDSDESFPNTHAEKQNAFMNFAAMAGKTPQGLQLLSEPKNLVLWKNLIGIQDLEIPGADSEEKQLGEIKELLAETPIPNMELAQQLAQAKIAAAVTGGQPPNPPSPTEMMLPSVEIDPDFDDHQAELTACKDWINSPVGQQAKRENPDGFMNVRLHALAHQKMVQQAQQAAIQQAMMPQLIMEKAKHSGQAKSPAESIQYKDLGPSGRIQLAAQAGIDVHADEAANLTEEQMGGMPENQPQKPQSQAKPAVS